jgi:hypothetical protein
MIRTQIYLTEEQSLEIKERARRERRREADVIRELLDRGRTSSQGLIRTNLSDFFAKLDALNLSGPTDLSTNFDDYLYGDKS